MRVAKVGLPIFLFLAFILVASFFPQNVFAEDPLAGSLVPTCDQAQNGGFIGACQLCDLVKLAQNLINFSIALSVVVATLLFAYAGFMYFTAASSPDNIKKAHGIFTKTLTGIVIILAAWLLVNILMTTITGGTLSLSDPIQCLTYPTRDSLPRATGVTGSGRVGAGATQRCDPASSGQCSVSNMGVFGAQASQASAVCQAESGGASRPATNTDFLVNDPQRRPFSFGLFQINATVHQLTAPECFPANARAGSVHNCPSAFACRNNQSSCRSQDKVIVNEDVYSRCAQSLRVAACNIATARQIWTNNNRRFDGVGNNPVWTAARRCGIE